jgi:hypothetical protein
MATLTEMVAAVVVHSSVAAFSHFGVTLEAPRAEPRPAITVEQRVVARTPRKTIEARAEKARASAADCPETQRLRPVKA